MAHTVWGHYSCLSVRICILYAAYITMMIIKVITVVNDETPVTLHEVAYLSKRSKNWTFSVSGSHVSSKLADE